MDDAHTTASMFRSTVAGPHANRTAADRCRRRSLRANTQTGAETGEGGTVGTRIKFQQSLIHPAGLHSAPDLLQTQPSVPTPNQCVAPARHAEPPPARTPSSRAATARAPMRIVHRQDANTHVQGKGWAGSTAHSRTGLEEGMGGCRPPQGQGGTEKCTPIPALAVASVMAGPHWPRGHNVGTLPDCSASVPHPPPAGSRVAP